MTGQASPGDWLGSFVPLGMLSGGSWTPVGAGVLVVDLPVVWLVTASSVVDRIEAGAGAWVRRTDGYGLLNLSEGQAQTGVSWIRHPRLDLAATLFPTDSSFAIKAFSEVQCTDVAGLQPMMPAVSIGCIYGPEAASPEHPMPALMDGILSRVDSESGLVYTTAPSLSRNTGGPLLLASPYGGAVSLAGILVRTALLPEDDPRTPPVRMSVAIAMDGVMELLRGDDAKGQRGALPRSSSAAGQPSSGAEPV